MNKTLVPIAAGSAIEYGHQIRAFCEANMDRIKKHVEDLEVLYKQ